MPWTDNIFPSREVLLKDVSFNGCRDGLASADRLDDSYPAVHIDPMYPLVESRYLLPEDEDDDEAERHL